MSIDVLVLNRNLKDVTDALCSSLDNLEGIESVFVIDSGSRPNEISERTLITDSSEATIRNGLRPSRGFNLGLVAWSKLESQAEWIMLLPNDAELLRGDFKQLTSILSPFEGVIAAIPISPDSPYENLLGSDSLALGWNFHEGPIIIRSSYVMDRILSSRPLFDPENFRGYCSFLELALQAYSQDRAMVATNLVSFSENTSHLLTGYELIGTEPLSSNRELLIQEGEEWLAKKYGYRDRRNLELVCRLVFEEYLAVHPELTIRPAM